MNYIRVAAWIPIVGLILAAKANESFRASSLQHLVGSHSLSIWTAISDSLLLCWRNPNLAFMLVLFLRYHRLVVNLYGYLFLYKITEIPEDPKYTNRNVHVILPTASPENDAFMRCVESALSHSPGWMTIVTAHPHSAAELMKRFPDIELLAQRYQVVFKHEPFTPIPGVKEGKREQIRQVLDNCARDPVTNQDTIFVFLDDHVWWPSRKFLPYLLAPFEDEAMGLVGTKKIVERMRNGYSWSDFLLNFIATTYLERHNLDITAANAIDGGTFVISGRTCALRGSMILKDDWREGFTNEPYFFRTKKPLIPDDDNYWTRYAVRNGYKIKIQNSEDACIVTTLGEKGWMKFATGQIPRWARAQWRSNASSLFHDTSFRRLPWTSWAFFFTWFHNFALVWDSLILYLWSRSDFEGFTIYHVGALVLGSKMVKLFDFFYRNPRDLWLFPLYVIWAWLHSFMKLYALLTIYDAKWGGRTGDKTGLEAISNNDDDEDDDNSDAKQPQPRDLLHPSSVPSNHVDDFKSSTSSHYSSNHSDSSGHPDAHYPVIAGFQSTTDESTNVHNGLPRGIKRESASSSNRGSSFTQRFGRKPILQGNPNVFTPWGVVRTGNLHMVPANLVESQAPIGGINGLGSSRLTRSPKLTSDDLKTLTEFCSVPETMSSSHRSHSSMSGFVHDITRPVIQYPTPSPTPGAVRTPSSLTNTHRSKSDTLPTSPSIGRSGSPRYSLRSQSRSVSPQPELFPTGIHDHDQPAVKQSSESPSNAYYLASIPIGPDVTVPIVCKSSTTNPHRKVTNVDYRKPTTPFKPQRNVVVANEPQSQYRRSFPRGDDCHRVHADGDFLTPGYFDGSKRRCRSPVPRYPVVSGRRL